MPSPRLQHTTGPFWLAMKLRQHPCLLMLQSSSEVPFRTLFASRLPVHPAKDRAAAGCAGGVFMLGMHIQIFKRPNRPVPHTNENQHGHLRKASVVEQSGDRLCWWERLQISEMFNNLCMARQGIVTVDILHTNRFANGIIS